MSDAIVFSNFNGKSYRDVFPDIHPLGETDFFLNCDSYQVLVPKKAPQTCELNLFERTILKLLALRPMMMPGEIAELLCLDGDDDSDKSDFVSCVLSSLVEREYLDASNRLTDKSRSQLPGSPALESKLELTAARLFAFRGTDRLIPLVCPDETMLAQGEYAGGYIAARSGRSKGSEGDIRGKAYTFGTPTSARPSGEAARKILGCAKEPTLTRSGPVFVHMKAIVQDGNVEDVLISDGFVRSNDALVKYLCLADPDFKGSMYKEAVRKYNRPEEPKRREGGRAKYPLVYKALDKINKYNEDARSADEKKKAQKDIIDGFQKLYAALEQALAYYLTNNPPDEQLKTTFCEQTNVDNRKLSQKIAHSLGFYTDFREAEGLLGRCDGAYLRRDLSNLNESPTLDRLLPLCLAEARCNPDSGWRRVAAEFPKLLPALCILREYAKKARHADNADKIDVGSFKYLNKTTQRVIGLLLPDYENMDQERSEIANASAEKVNALVGMTTGDPDDIEKLTYMQYERLPEGAKQEVLAISPWYDDKGSMLGAPDFILTLSKTAEIVLREKIAEIPSPQEKLAKSEALRVLTERLGARPPAGLTKVGEHFYDDAANGRRASIGAYALVWATRLNAEKFDRTDMAEILDFISQVAEHRKHGNDIGLSLGVEQLKAYRRGLFKLIKKMEE